MKYLLYAITTIFFASSLIGATATKELNPELEEIFQQFKVSPENSDLEGKEFEIDLTIKVATGKFLVFSDAYLRVDEETKYQIGKWDFPPDQIAALSLKRGDVCRVRFKIEKLRINSPYPDMPHFTAKILAIEIVEDEVDPDGGINSGSRRSPA